MVDKAGNQAVLIEDDRTGLDVETLKRAFYDNLFYIQGKFPRIATRHDHYMALAYTVRDRLLHRWLNTVQTYMDKDVRMVCYLSAEFLMGPHLANNLTNMGLMEPVRQALSELGLNFDEIIASETEPGLGNGGLGRLAACFLDSMASLDIPAFGYGIRYEFGIFDQLIRDGWQVEITDKWLQQGNPWEIARPEARVEVGFGGYTQWSPDKSAPGKFRVRWLPGRKVVGIPYDTPIPGYKTETATNLRLWKAEAHESFDLEAFNTGDYHRAVAQKMESENISKILYPNDNTMAGKKLRLEQEYFFVSSSLQDMVRLHIRRGNPIEKFHEKMAFQLNDTHPAVAVAELMRILVDDHDLEWDAAWNITRKTFAYTNHTLLPEALERWSVALFAEVLPRHLEIIYEINRRFLEEVRAKYPNDVERIRRMSLIDEGADRQVRMAHLACVGAHAINGVAELHTELLKKNVLKDFYEMYPQKFSNKTNGVTPRRWLLLSNPRLSSLITEYIGDNWARHSEDLRKLAPLADDARFRELWRKCKLECKQDLSKYFHYKQGLDVNPNSIFDMQVKRIHEYKRQHLNVLHIIALYNKLKEDPSYKCPPRTFIFGGKAAPGYYMAKLIIKLINSVGEVVNNDPEIGDRLKVVFAEDLSVKLGQRLYPAADLSEQISTAGYEASGTGNMKFAMNGAVTIGTLDGANIEIREQVGAENFFLFGLTADLVAQTKKQGYHARSIYQTNERLRQVIDQISSGFFSRGDKGLFQPIIDSLLGADPYMLLADFDSYVNRQEDVGLAFLNEDAWTRMSIMNVAHSGKFSSDRTIAEYCQEIWKIDPVEIEIRPYEYESCLLDVPKS